MSTRSATAVGTSKPRGLVQFLTGSSSAVGLDPTMCSSDRPPASAPLAGTAGTHVRRPRASRLIEELVEEPGAHGGVVAGH
jgi:hypothetical protein